MDDEQTPEELSLLERINALVQEFVEQIYDGDNDGQPILLRGGVITWESMTFLPDGDPMFAVNYAALPNTSMASVIGILDLATDVAKGDMLGDDEE